MNDSDRQELKPVYIQEVNYSADDEISLVDLAMVLIRRKTIIAVIFTLTLALGVAKALFTPKTYTYSTTIEIGHQMISGSIQPFESPQALVAKLQFSYIPQILVERKKSSPDDKKRYQITSSVPEGSNITLLEIKGTEDQTDTLVNLLKAVSQKAVQDHSRIFTSVKSGLETRLNHASNTLKSFKNDSNNKSEIAITQTIIETIELQLSNLHNTREILSPIRSINPTGGSRKLIVVISAFAGLFLGVFSAFFAEFSSKIKEKINKEGKE